MTEDARVASAIDRMTTATEHMAEATRKMADTLTSNNEVVKLLTDLRLQVYVNNERSEERHKSLVNDIAQLKKDQEKAEEVTGTHRLDQLKTANDRGFKVIHMVMASGIGVVAATVGAIVLHALGVK